MKLDNPWLWLTLFLLALLTVFAYDINLLRGRIADSKKPFAQGKMARDYVQVGSEMQRMRWNEVCK